MIQTDLYGFSYKKGSLAPLYKKCKARHFYKKGKNAKEIQRYQYKNCGFRFVWTSDLPRYNVFSKIIDFAIKMYIETGISLRTLAKKLKKIFNVNVSYEAIRL